MPELPDLLYIRDTLERSLVGARVSGITVRQPVVLRNALPASPDQLLRDNAVQTVEIHGPFLRFSFQPDVDLVVNLMLSGRFHLQRNEEKLPGHLCVVFVFTDRKVLALCDDQKMAKVYLVPRGDFRLIPGYTRQGVDILGAGFTLDLFRELVTKHRRKQARVMIHDHSILSSIGNAYADEVLFEAGIHPKTVVANLTDDDVEKLYGAVREVMSRGARAVREAAQPIHVKVRDHLRVRNRHGQPCPRCGTTIRREGVRGYDVYFCPQCQPATRRLFIEWRNGN